MTDIEFKDNTHYKLSNSNVEYIIYVSDKVWGVKYVKINSKKLSSKWQYVYNTSHQNHTKNELLQSIELDDLSVEKEMTDGDVVLELL